MGGTRWRQETHGVHEHSGCEEEGVEVEGGACATKEESTAYEGEEGREERDGDGAGQAAEGLIGECGCKWRGRVGAESFGFRR